MAGRLVEVKTQYIGESNAAMTQIYAVAINDDQQALDLVQKVEMGTAQPTILKNLTQNELDEHGVQQGKCKIL